MRDFEFTSYQYMGLLPTNSKTVINDLEAAIKSTYSKGSKKPSLNATSHSIDVAIDQYHFRIILNDDSSVIDESKEMAEIFTEDFSGNPLGKEAVASCTQRLEMGGEEDFNMDYFNDSLFLAECMEKIGAIVIDPGAAS